MSIKLLTAKLKNFCKFDDFVCEFDGKITRLVGLNGSGKTTVGLKGLIACLKGISEKSSEGQLVGNRFRFIGKNGKSADLEYQFIDERTGGKFTIKNHMTESTNKITFKSDSGETIDDSWLKNFLNISLMSAKNFCSMSGRDQALALGIDASSFDAELKKLKEEYTYLNRELKAFGEIPEVQQVEAVSIEDLRAKKAAISADLNEQYKRNKKHNADLREKHAADEKKIREETAKSNKSKADLTVKRNDISDHIAAIKRHGYAGHDLDTWFSTIPVPEAQAEALVIPEPAYIDELPSDAALQDINNAILDAQGINAKAAAYQEYVKRKAAKEAKQNEIKKNETDQAASKEARNKYIASHDFGFAGLSTDETGCLLLNDRPLSDAYFSKGELEIIVAKLHASINPIFKTRFIDDFDLIDDKNQEKILNELFEAGFQVITAEVGEEANKENCLVLRECKILTGEEERPTLL